MDAAGLDDRSLTNDRVCDLAVHKFAGGQIPRTGINREGFVVETEGWCWLLSEGQIGFIEGTDGSDVFPVIVKDVALKSVATGQRFRDHLFTEILVAGIGIKEIEERFTTEHIDAHGSEVGALLRGLNTEAKTGRVYGHCL